MYSTILLYRDKSCLLCGCADGLSLQTAKNGKIVSEKHLCRQPLVTFDADLCANGGLDAVALTCDNALLYISHADDSVCLNKIAAVQPPYRIITPVLIRIQNQLFLYYAATNGTHYSIVSYQKSKSWSGQTLYNSPAPLSIKGVCKQENTLFAERSDTNGGYTLLSVCSGGTKQLAQSASPFSFVQKLNGDLIYQCGQKIFLNHSELCSATTPCLCNGKLLTCMTAKGVQRLFLTDTAPDADLCFAQEAWQLYSLCKEDFKGYLISAPFPALTLPDAQPCQDLLARIEALTAVTKCQQFKIDTLTRELETLKRQLTIVSGNGIGSSLT